MTSTLASLILVFATNSDAKRIWEGHLSNSKITDFATQLKKDAKPFTPATFWSAPVARQLELFELEKQFGGGENTPVVSERAVPVHLATKKDGQFRLCIAHRELTKRKLKNSNLLPSQQNCIDSLVQTKIHSTVNAYSGYWQMDVRNVDRSKIASFTHTGIYRHLCMVFGLTNVFTSFQWALNVLLTNYRWETSFVYLDDVIINSNTTKEHIDHLDNILKSRKHEYHSQNGGVLVLYSQGQIYCAHHQHRKTQN